MFTHHTHKLKSGLTVITVPMESVASLTVMAFANTGSRYEKPDQYGIAHFFEHIVFKGTEKFATPQDLAETVDSIGAEFNAFTSKEYTGYYIQAASRHLELALDVISDMLLTPRLRQEDIDREKGVIIEEMNMYADMPAAHIGNLFEQMAFRGNGLEHDIIGLKETVMAIDTAKFQSFLDTWYGPDNLTLVVAGDADKVDQPETIKLIEQMFAKSDRPKSNGQHKYKNQILSTECFHFEKRKTEQAHFVMGWEGIRRDHEDRFALNLIKIILGGNMSSRLFSEVREKRGLCYYVHADVTQYKEGGIFGASAGVDPSRVEEAIQASVAEFTKIANGDNKITQAELDRAREYILGKTVLSLEDSQSVAQFYGLRRILHDKIESPEEVFEQIKSVELEQVQSLAERLIKNNGLKFAIIGDFDEEQINQFKELVNI